MKKDSQKDCRQCQRLQLNNGALEMNATRDLKLMTALENENMDLKKKNQDLLSALYSLQNICMTFPPDQITNPSQIHSKNNVHITVRHNTI